EEREINGIERELRTNRRNTPKTDCSPSHSKDVTFSTRLAADTAINNMSDYAKYLATSVGWCAGCRNFILQTN
ncbi:MAG TPA: hypothetical protein VF281_02970, partial [Candidatus Saccharimonadales bacterium]